MQRSYARKVITFFSVIVFLAMLSFVNFSSDSIATSCTGTPCDENISFRIGVDDTLTISITNPPTWASGGLVNTSGTKKYSNLLRNKITVNVETNNTTGFTASMTTATANGNLVNTRSDLSTDVIPRLTSSWTRSNTSTTKFWGYSLNDGEETGTYYGVARLGDTPTTILTSNVAAATSADVYFGAKADSTISSGTYAETVIINVVTGVSTGS